MPIVVDVNVENLEQEGIFCSKNRKYEGFRQKQQWMKRRFAEGLRFKILRDEEGQDLGFIEYTSGEQAWRPVAAEGYYFIHCIYISRRKDREHGYGSQLLRACLEDAKASGKLGAAMAVSEGPWIAGKDLLVKNGFETVDQKGRFELMVKQVREGPQPHFYDWEAKQSDYQGWHLLFAQQCPFHEKAVLALAELAEQAGIDLQIKELKTAEEAQEAPSGYGVFSLLRDGRLLEDHYISQTRFRNILKKEAVL